jgi:hypothetical protein
VEAFNRLDALSEETKADVFSELGWPIDKSQVLQQSAHGGHWTVVAQRVVEEDRLRVQRTWLGHSQSARQALLLQYAHGQFPFEQNFPTGSTLEGDLCYYPSSAPMRALFKTGPVVGQPATSLPGSVSVTKALSRFNNALASRPWMDRDAIALSAVKLSRHADRWFVFEESSALPIHPRYSKIWQLVAVGGGNQFDLWGEWDGEYLWPLTVATHDEWVAL